ncbi:hypothetical protein E2C01_101992 [Portunus trituberculatus]|uniref:Uncharacterized protein n=1 Tax=Portunus trituberculatus TaxID=210409 RepID=A0A5B7KLI9_PORTR|nr:hypothetical protein [Portunus trituberculatus]
MLAKAMRRSVEACNSPKMRIFYENLLCCGKEEARRCWLTALVTVREEEGTVEGMIKEKSDVIFILEKRKKEKVDGRCENIQTSSLWEDNEREE